MGYIVIWVQVDVIKVMKEKETDALVMPWINTQMAYLLAVQQATATAEDV